LGKARLPRLATPAEILTVGQTACCHTWASTPLAGLCFRRSCQSLRSSCRANRPRRDSGLAPAL